MCRKKTITIHHFIRDNKIHQKKKKDNNKYNEFMWSVEYTSE